MTRHDRFALSVLLFWLPTVLAIAVSAALHDTSIGTVALIGQDCALIGLFVGMWVERGPDRLP